MRWGRLTIVIALSVAVLFAAFGLFWAIGSWQLRTSLAQAKLEIASRRYGLARDRLAWLAARWPGQAEVEFQLGICEQALGHPGAALAAWERVPLQSPYAEAAVLWREQVALAQGRFAVVEEILVTALRRHGSQASEVRRRLVRLYRFESRLDDVARLLEANWAESRDQLIELVEHASLDLEPAPLNAVRLALEKASQMAPDDDRVWLGRANLAIRRGHFDEAARWLDACLLRRPDDPAVWRSRLEWALASDQPEAARQVVSHLEADQCSASQILALRAWLAAHQHDLERERLALEELVARDPGQGAALERLIELAFQAGQSDRATELRKRKAELDGARHWYRTYVFSTDPMSHAGELPRLADTLGRRFEARGWATLLARSQPHNEEARAILALLERSEPPRPPAGQTLWDLLKDFDSIDRSARPSPSAESPPPAPKFVDDAAAAHLRFTYQNGQSLIHQLPETMGGGVALFDFDGDGWLDVYAVQGGPFPPDPSLANDGDRLFRNRRDGTFEDVTAAAGLAGTGHGYGHGVTVGDYDNDGHPDVFVTRWRAYALYRNRGDGRFEDVTSAAGLGGDRDWPTSAAWADLDGDGDLDLYVCHYLAWDPQNPRICRNPQTQAYEYCVPRLLDTVPDHVFRNDDGHFVDVSSDAGLLKNDGPGLGVVAADLDGDGRVDLYVANDGTANLLYHNLGGFRFEELGHAAGVACNASGGYQSGMGVACGDLDGDGLPDLMVTNFYGESTTYFHNLGQGIFCDHTSAAGLLAASRSLLGFGVAFLDFNNDGFMDLATANGHVNDLRPNFPYAMPAQLLAGRRGGGLADVSERAGAAWRVPRIGRGLAAGDVDNDGRIDLLVVGQNEPLAYIHNRTEGGHFVTFRLEGTTSNRDGIGARVALTSGARRQVAQRVGGGSYQSACDHRLHFGLGASDRIQSVEVSWPSGRVDRYHDLKGDTGYHLREGQSSARPLIGYPSRP